MKYVPPRFNEMWLFVLAVGTRLVILASSGYLVDDAMITFRYAENLAGGLGFVYNAGESVLGTTSPLWTMFLAAANICGLSVPLTAQLTSILFAGVSTIIVYRLSGWLGAGPFAIVAGLVTALHPRLVATDICGLETALFTMLVLLAFSTLHRAQFSRSLIIAALAIVTRPEGAIVFVGVLFIVWWNADERPWLGLSLALAIASAWIGFAAWSFGSPIPNSLLAKTSLYSHTEISVLRRLAEMLTLTNALGWVLWIGAAIAVCVKSPQRFWLFALAGIVLFIAIPTGIFSHRIFFWYPSPLIPVVIVLAATGFAHLLSMSPLSQVSRLRRVLVPVMCLTIIGASTVLLAKRSTALRSEMEWYQDTHIAAANYLNSHVESHQIVIAEDIGHFGDHYRGRIIDRDGLVSPEAIAYNQSGRYFDLVDSIDADWILLAVDHPSSKSILEDPRFRERYRAIELATTASHPTHKLFQRLRSDSVI